MSWAIKQIYVQNNTKIVEISTSRAWHFGTILDFTHFFVVIPTVTKGFIKGRFWANRLAMVRSYPQVFVLIEIPSDGKLCLNLLS